MNNIVTVRWWDGYLEEFECIEVRFGCDLLWLRLSNGSNRHIPLRQVRWFSTSIESHERRTDENGICFGKEQSERKKGKWIKNDNGTYSCSLCHSWIPEEQHYYAQFCLYCGADMRGEQNEL